MTGLASMVPRLGTVSGRFVDRHRLAGSLSAGLGFVAFHVAHLAMMAMAPTAVGLVARFVCPIH